MINNFTSNKRIKSQYKYVQGFINDKNIIRWYTNIYRVHSLSFDTEREAAIAVDKYFINKGKEPKNILKRKLN